MADFFSNDGQHNENLIRAQNITRFVIIPCLILGYSALLMRAIFSK